MLARRLTTILPAMTLAEAIETTRIHRVAGLTGDRTAWVATRPCRAPHHTISDAGLIGGGHVPMPGEASLAHNGVLFLDEPPECRRHVLEVLRQPLDDDGIDIQSPSRPGFNDFGELAIQLMTVRGAKARPPSRLLARRRPITCTLSWEGDRDHARCRRRYTSEGIVMRQMSFPNPDATSSVGRSSA
jgi:Magnesium chelatase, subunit ChlI